MVFSRQCISQALVSSCMKAVNAGVAYGANTWLEV